MLVHDLGSVGRGAGIVIEPVALRFNFDGEGWSYSDTGIASYFQARYQDAEPLYTAEVLAEARAEERASIVALLRKFATEMLEVEPSLDDKLGAEALRNAADQLEAGP